MVAVRRAPSGAPGSCSDRSTNLRTAAPPGVHSVIEDLSFEDALLYTASLFDSASATTLNCSEMLASPERAKILAVWHLLELARTTVDRAIECLKPAKAMA
ncbi:hypothetical protein QF043_002139 [Pseudomonas sp. W3I7]|nr:hypothetical protein [Pseudomonas sp. W3I7]